jgi:flagellar biosynthesis protein FlhG
MDQAQGIRQMNASKPVRVMAVTSGKGGVGKSNITVNLAVAMAQCGENVIVMDADLGLANIDVLLGLSPKLNLSHVIQGECSLEEIIIDGPAGIKIIPASSGSASMSDLTPAENAGVIRSFSELTQPLDTLLIDTAAGLSDSVISYLRAAREVIVVVCDEPASITDAYAMIKVLNRDFGVQRFHVLANQTQSIQQGRDLYMKLSKVSEKYLDATLDFLGSVPYDEYLKKAVQKTKVCD